MFAHYAALTETPRDSEAGSRPAGKRTLTAQLSARTSPTATSATPRRAADEVEDPFALHLSDVPARSADRLPAPLQAKMEASFSTDFSSVRVRQDGSAEQLDARAYASGEEIHFAAGQYDPDSQAGQALIGHELAHVVQQRSGRVAGDGLVVDAGLEDEADLDGARAARGESVGRGATSGVASATAMQGKLTQAAGVKQAMPIAVPPALASAWGALVAWCSVEANVTALGILTGLASGAVGGIAPIIQPGSSGVQAYTIAPWKSADAEGRLTMYVQAQLINAAVRAYGRMKPPSAGPAPGVGQPPAAPGVGQPPAAPVVGQPVGEQPAAPLDPSLLEALKVAAQAEVNADLAMKIQRLVKTSSSDPEFVWSDSGSNKPDTLGTVGAIRLNRVRTFRMDENLKLDAEALAIPEIRASWLDGKPIRICGVFGGDLVPGQSWRLGMGDNLAINVQSRDELPDGISLNTTWNWDNAVTTMSIGVQVGDHGQAIVKEISRAGTPDDNWLMPGAPLF